MTQKIELSDIGFIGLGVMGQNLVLNLADNGYTVAVFDVNNDKVQAVIAQDRLENTTNTAHRPRVHGCSSYAELLSQLKAPHLLIISVPAGSAVDDVCNHLISAGIQPDDIIIDTGNSLWLDTVAREKKYKSDFVFFSSAISGGEVGARFGPSLMPSGSGDAWARIKPMWQAIAAKVDASTGKPIIRTQPGQVIKNGEPCTDYIGPAGSGHYVKMVHNGIEYADMQIICEVYHVLKSSLQLSCNEIANIFSRWNDGPLNSYLMEISVEVLRHHSTDTNTPLVELILDKAEQKGTGLWTAVSSLEVGCPTPTITQAVYARSISSFKALRTQASNLLAAPQQTILSTTDQQTLIEQLHDGMYCAKICAYAQGFQLMKLAAKEQNWVLNFASIAKIWRAGCIIRAAFLQSISQAYERNDNLANLLVDDFFSQELNARQQNWRKAVCHATMQGVPVGALSASLAYFDAMRSETLPANLLQAQRDFFGAHTFERNDKAPGEKYHVQWSTSARATILIDS